MCGFRCAPAQRMPPAEHEGNNSKQQRSRKSTKENTMAKMRISKAKNNDDLLPEDNSELLGNQYAHQHYAKRKAAADARAFVAHYERNYGKVKNPLGEGLNAPPMTGALPTNQAYTAPTKKSWNPVPMTGAPSSSRIAPQPASPNSDLLGEIVDRPQTIATGVREHLE